MAYGHEIIDDSKQHFSLLVRYSNIHSPPPWPPPYSAKEGPPIARYIYSFELIFGQFRLSKFRVSEPKKLLKSKAQKGPNASCPVRHINRHNNRHMFHLSSSLTHACANNTKVAFIYRHLLTTVHTFPSSYYWLALVRFSPEHPLLSPSSSSSRSYMHFTI